MCIKNDYNPNEIETRWQQAWSEKGLHRASKEGNKQKLYCLDYFPYPSGEGLHVGHCRNYVPTDVISRFKRMQGYNVLHPMGWDSFGEPAEQNAIKNNVTPRVVTDQNTTNYKSQMRMIGLSYDWEREIDSSQPEFYRWTQWMFLLMYKRGLVYRDTNWQWWCPTCATTLSNNEIDDDQCWRGHKGVTKKEIPAWFFRITIYADELIDGLDTVDWPEPIKRMQRNWIGRSEGVMIKFPVDCDRLKFGENRLPLNTEDNLHITTFTTRPDTIYGVTFLALAPEHSLVSGLTIEKHRVETNKYIDQSIRLSEVERVSSNRQNSGVFSGSYAVNPVNGKRVPIFIADYVLLSYGTGAVMGVPAHDQRDYEFAQLNGLEIRDVIVPNQVNFDVPKDKAFTESGLMVNSGPFDGLQNDKAIGPIVEFLEKSNFGHRSVNYRMRDWLISRQRFWGTPIPIIFCGKCGEMPVPESDLPVQLPEMNDFSPDGSGCSPLGRSSAFVNTFCPKCGGPAQRETDTMGGFACSSWYFLRFTSPNYQLGPFKQKAVDYWMPVDLYVGGAEHAVLHLLYARFWTRVLADEGLLSFREPFSRLINQGQLHGTDGQRMSKSRGNVVTPDEIVAEYGADTLRIYSMFMGPFTQNVDWNMDGITGVRRFLNRVWNLILMYWLPASEGIDLDLDLELHRTIKEVTVRIETFRFNTMVSVLMAFVNLLYERVKTDDWQTTTFQKSLEVLIVLMAPAAPHFAEELWATTDHQFSVHQQNWPKYNEEKTVIKTEQIAVQVNGKIRGNIPVERQTTQKEALDIAFGIPTIQKYLREREIVRVIYVPGKILNIVIAGQ